MVEALFEGPRPAGAGLATALAMLRGPVLLSRGGKALGAPHHLPAVVAFGEARVPPEGSFCLSFASGLALSGRIEEGVASDLRAAFGSRELPVPQRALLLASPALPSVAGGPGDPGAWDWHFGAPAPDEQGEARAREHRASALSPRLAELYRSVRSLREGGRTDAARLAELAREASRFPDEWLLHAELAELEPGPRGGGGRALRAHGPGGGEVSCVAHARPRPEALALALLLGTGCGRGARAARGSPSRRCQLTHPSAAASASARCGTLEVPEDWDRPSGRRLRLRVAVIASESGSPAPEALFFLAGGPGQAATEQYPVVAPALAAARRGRDVVLVDQRGTGGSAPLTCPTLARGDGAALPEDDVQRLGACARKLTASGMDLAHYGTRDFVRDLEAVRAALGHPRVDLVAVSYGTRAALAWLRAYPERIRALVLDGVVPPGVAIGASAAGDVRRALELHLRRCRADAACRARFPGLDARSGELMLRLARAPARLSVPDPLLGTPRTVELGPAQVRRVASLLAYAPETAALWPCSSSAQPPATWRRSRPRCSSSAATPRRRSRSPCSTRCSVPRTSPSTRRRDSDDAEDERGARRAPVGLRRLPGAGPAPGAPHAGALRRPRAAPLRRGRPGDAAGLGRARAPAISPGRATSSCRAAVTASSGAAAFRSSWRGFLDGADGASLDASCLERSRPAPFLLDAVGPAP